jgi:hypothetical protein
MKKLMVVLISLFIAFHSVLANSKEKEQNLIQIALLLDTSNSMDGLINQAKAQLWKIVNEFAVAKRNGKSPRLEIALYEYGNNSISSSNGYIRQVAGLTGDLDRISDELFRLSTNGGDEYCGEVIEKAVDELKWDRRDEILKMIFIAGNEPFTQGSHDYKKTCKAAVSAGITVNTIFCGNRDEGISTNWKDGADISDGIYANIDQDQPVAYITAPQDDEINRLGQELNNTYIAYGDKGKKNKALQEEQDTKAGYLAPSVMAERNVAKSSAQYSNSSWDLIDASVQDPSLVEKLEKDQLPKEMQKMNKAEQKAYVKSTLEKRKNIQEKINRLNEERRLYVKEQEKNSSKNNTLDGAMLESVRKQAEQKHYKFQ